MDNIKKELSIYRLEKAKEYLDTATALFNMNKYLDCNNRAYYSVFYAIKAILALKEIDFKKHSSVLAYFNKEYIKSEVFPKELGKKLSKLSTIRESSDYEDFYIATKEEAKEQLETAKYTIELIEEYINKI